MEIKKLPPGEAKGYRRDEKKDGYQLQQSYDNDRLRRQDAAVPPDDNARHFTPPYRWK